MRFNINNWNEVKPYEKVKNRTGALRVMCSKPSSVYVTCQGCETLIGVGTEVKAEIAETVDIHVEADGDTRVFVETPQPRCRPSEGEKFTNADRLPLESGSVIEVKKALRLMKVQQKQMQQEFAEQRRYMNEAKEKTETPQQEVQHPKPDELQTVKAQDDLEKNKKPEKSKKEDQPAE